MSRRPVYTIGSGIPRVGTLAFGVVDRGTNVLEVRPTSVCALSCIFCSVNAGPLSQGQGGRSTSLRRRPPLRLRGGC